MSEKLTVRVDASKEHPENLTVQDAFTHVLELFQLVDDSDPANHGNVVWRLVSVSMNSPLTVTAEAVPARYGMQIEDIAKKQIRAFATNYSELRRGAIPRAWSEAEPRKLVNRMLARSQNGIGRTTIDSGLLSEIGPIEITADDAAKVVAAVSAQALPTNKTKEQIGSIEGQLVLVHQHYGQPAIQIIERKTKELIWCVVPAAFQHEISESTTVEDVWRGSRVIVKGKILYGSDGKISRVIASSVRRFGTATVLEETIADTEFTGGRSVSEYLEKFRDGTLGQS